MGSLAFIFPGQGSQAVGMGKSLYTAFPEARAVIDEASAALSLDMQRLCFEGPETALTLTASAQPAILTVSVAALRAFGARSSLRPAVVAGHSLGEYSALVAAGVLDLASAVRAVRARGTFMQEAVPPGVGAMAAVLGLPASTVREACEAVAGGDVVSPANYNEPMQTVIAGHAAAVERAREKLTALGAKRVIPLAVSAPFHCALMAPVVPRLSAVFGGTTFSPYTVPLVANVTAQSSSATDRTAALLLEQVTAPVRWVESVEEMVRQGVTRFIEFGPGKVLGGLTRRIAKGVECFNVEDEASLNKTLSAIEGGCLKDFEKKVALVTGGSRGIGREVCRELARRGATVVVAFGGNEAAANETLAIVQQESGGTGAIKRFDVADPKSCAEAVDAVVTAHGRLDVLVNNAGITSDALLLRAKDEDWERTLATNLQGPFSLMRAACRVMMKQRAGAIVNISSVVGEMGNPGQAAYSASKAGLIGLTKAVARELGSRNVRVNAVTPGYIATDMTASLAETSKQALVDNIALGRIGDPKEVAAAVVFLASDAAAYITGAVLRVNGGLYM